MPSPNAWTWSDGADNLFLFFTFRFYVILLQRILFLVNFRMFSHFQNVIHNMFRTITYESLFFLTIEHPKSVKRYLKLAPSTTHTLEQLLRL